MKSTTTAYLLFIFLGGLGIHRFYLERPWTGVLYLFTFGLFGFGLIYDLFAIPSMVRAANGEKYFGSAAGGAALTEVESSNQNAQNITINLVAPGVPDVKNEPAPESPFPGVAEHAAKKAE